MSDKPMMQCGHAANAIDGNGAHVCAICAGIKPGARLIDTTRDLSGRTAICSYTWRTPGMHAGDIVRQARERGYVLRDGMVESSSSLAFFKHQPDQPYDQYYCGCFGWD